MSKFNELRDALKALRPRCRDRYGDSKLSEDGIWLVNRFRYMDSAKDFAAMVRDAGGDVLSIRKNGKTQMVDGECNNPIRVTFSVGVSADLYLAGRATMADLKQWEAEAS